MVRQLNGFQIKLKQRAAILKLLKNLAENENYTIVIVTHNANIANIADHLIRLADGKIISDELIENPKNVEDIEW